MKVAEKYNPPPHAIPTAADSHTEAAVAMPRTVWLVCPVISSLIMSCTTRPAPRNPTPVGTAADTLAYYYNFFTTHQ